MADCSQNLVGAQAFCSDPNCPWKTEGKNAMGNAAQHADATGHTVKFELNYVGEAKPEGAGK